MSTPRIDKFRLVIAALFLTLYGAAPHAAAQGDDTGPPRQRPQQESPDVPSPETARGRLLLEQGDTEGAIAVLRPAAERTRLDGEAWHLLGVAYARQGRQQDALKAFGLAVAARLDRVGGVPNAERFVKLTAAERATVKERALKRYAEAQESVEEYLKQNPQDAPLWRAQSATLKAHAEYVASIDNEYANARPDSRAVRLFIEDKPEPGYTEEARRNGTGGRVRIRAIFGADGTVTHPLAVRPLPHGLTEKAFEAARRIRFQPATVDGRPVSQFIMLEYGFAIDQRGPYPFPRPRTRRP